MNSEKMRHYIERANDKGFFHWLPDKYCLYLLYWARLGKRLNLNNPQTFNEKLQWLKLYNRRPEFTRMVDKYEAKKYVADIIGEEHIIPTLGVWERFEDIDFDALPDQFVLKCTHDSGGLVVVRDKTMLDVIAAKVKINQSLKENYYLHGREWPYKYVKPRIIAEKYMEEQNVRGLCDYKFYCFSGEPRYLYVSEGLENHATAKISFLTLDWNFAEFGRSDFLPFTELPLKPQAFDKMVEFARKLSAGHSFLRVDLYDIMGEVYFSELTFTPAGGYMPFDPESWDLKLGELIDLQQME